MKKEWLMTLATVALTLVASLGLIRWFAPQLLGVPADLQLVQSSESVPPFFDGIFRLEDVQSKKFILLDPVTRVRAKPLFPAVGGMGPNDVLGFRNRGVPNVADVVVIGDSQTYGNNAALENNWPSQMRNLLDPKRPVVYSMAVGGWGAIQYLKMVDIASVLQPRVLVVAFYTGNDPLESFQMAYGAEPWHWLIPDRSLSMKDIPNMTFPAPESEWWKVAFADGVHTVFTPTLRLASNQDHPAVKAGYEIMADVARRIAELAESLSVRLVLAVVPTKELVYALKVEQEGLAAPADYLTLVRHERENIDRLGRQLADLKNATYVDLVGPLQQAAITPTALYPPNINGHPIAAGYQVIAQALVPAVDSLLPGKPEGLVAVRMDSGAYRLVVVNGDGVWPFASEEILFANGWPPGEIMTIEPRDIIGLPVHATVKEVDPDRYGPG